MFAKACLKSSGVFGYDDETDQTENNADVKDLYRQATTSKPPKKLFVLGGLHGLDPSGVPSGQEPNEKTTIDPGEATVTLGGVKVTTFALNDIAMKKETGINFVYKNIGIYATKGSDVTPQKQKEILDLIKQYRDSGNYIVLMSWCFSRTWGNSNNL